MASAILIERRKALHRGASLHYLHYTPAARATTETVILVHGLASSGNQFEQDAMTFATGGYRVIVPDLRGHGETGLPSGGVTAEAFSIPVMAADMLAVLEDADVHAVHWVGNSLGGILALSLLGTEHADRIRSLALFGTCFSMNLPKAVPALLRLAFLPGASITAGVTAQMTTKSAAGRKSIAASIRQLDVAAGAAIAAHVRQYDFLDNARTFNRPLLLLHGGKDHAVNFGLKGDLAKLAGHPSLRRVDLPLGGHCANFDMPDEFAAALEKHWAGARQGVASVPAPPQT